MPRGETLFNVLQWNPDLFKDIVVPEGMEKDMVVDSVLDLCGMLPVAFFEPIFLKRKIDFWFRRELDVFQRLWDSENFEYNPLDDYDIHETGGTNRHSTQESSTDVHETVDEDGKIDNGRDITDTLTKKSTQTTDDTTTDTKTQTTDNTTTDTKTQTTDNTTTDKINQKADSDSNATTENKVSAFNAAIYSPADEATNDASSSTTTTADATNKFDGTITDSGKVDFDGNVTENGKVDYDGRVVVDATDTTVRSDDFSETNSKDTTRDRTDSFSDEQNEHTDMWHHKVGRTRDAQGLIEKQRDVVKFCTYDYIAREFMVHFCITVW